MQCSENAVKQAVITADAFRNIYFNVTEHAANGLLAESGYNEHSALLWL